MSNKRRFFNRYGEEVEPFHYNGLILDCIGLNKYISGSYHRDKVYIRDPKNIKFHGKTIMDIEEMGYHLSISRNFRVSFIKNKKK